MRQIQEERSVAVLANELRRPFHIAPGQGCLVRLTLDEFVALHEGKRGPLEFEVHPRGLNALVQFLKRWLAGGCGLASHVVAVRQPEPFVEAMIRREKFRLIAAVPLADSERRVSGVTQHRRNGHLVGVQTDTLSGEQHAHVVHRFTAEPDSCRVTAGQHRCSGRRADRRGHVEVREESPLGGEGVERWCVMELGAVAAEVAVPEVVAVDEHNVGSHGFAFENEVPSVGARVGTNRS